MNSVDYRAAAAELLRDSGELRVPIHGTSMLPSLREPMVLQIGAVDGARVGDVLVFRMGETRVAHRIVGKDARGFRTAGDAQPAVVEVVPLDAVIGRVVAVWSDASPRAVRIDGSAHRLRAWYFARLHALRVRRRRWEVALRDLAVRVQPRHRKRTIPRLLEALTAALDGTPDRLAAALSSPALDLRAIEQLHRSSAFLGEAARRNGIVERLPPDLAAYLRQSRLQAMLGTSRLQRSVCAAVEIVRATGAPFALLKGAARVYAGVPEAAYHPSDDIDLLVPEADLDRVVEAFRERGYRHRDDAAEVRIYRRTHHHAASLFPPDGSHPIEVHRALARPKWLSIPTDWNAIEPFMVTVDGPAGPVLQLDALGTALHLTAHALGFERLRDVALLAQALRRLDAGQLIELRAIVRSENIDRIRLEAGLVLAARMAGLAWPADSTVDQYIWWALRREDLPIRLRTRCAAVEAFFASPARRWHAVRQLIPWWSRGTQLLAVVPRIIGRCCSNAAAAAYALLLPDHDGRRLS